MNLSKGTATDAGQSCGFSAIADVTGSAYADTITGDTNAHVIMAGAGADTVYGNGGADKLIGGAGADTLTGGAGNDAFVYILVTDSPTTGPDLITDFVHGTDKIDLSALHTHSSDKFMIVSTGGYTYVEVDLLGNGSIDEMVKVAGANAVSTSDVIWANAAFPATLPHAATQSPEIAAHHELTNSLHAIAVDGSALEQRYHKASEMVGVLPIGTLPGGRRAQAAFFWSLRVDRLDAWHARGLAAWKDEVLALWPACAPLLDQIVEPDQLVFARYAHRTLRDVAEPALIHLRDAWHSASPQLGQGANMALLDRWALAKGLREERDVPRAIAQAVAMRRRHVRLYQALTALFTPVYQSDSVLPPLVRDRLVRPLSKLWPATRIQAAMVSGLIGNPFHSLGLGPTISLPMETQRGGHGASIGVSQSDHHVRHRERTFVATKRGGNQSRTAGHRRGMA